LKPASIKILNPDLLNAARSFILSLGIHALVFVLLSFLLAYVERDPVSSGYVELTALRGITAPEETEQKPEETLKEETVKEKEEPAPAETKEEKPAPVEEAPSSGYLNMKTSGFDSTSLHQVYHETTLNLKMKYPAGWVYLDQQVKKKIDGITFWAAQSNFDPPPYIHVEVLEKYLFNESKYKYKHNFRNFTGFYNDPVEMDNQVTQVVYIRTNDDEDFSIKLIMKGQDQFKAFQPVFFAMIKSFKFGNSIF